MNRELSWLQLNARVLELAQDARVPLLERVRFLSIVASMLDEFFMVRVSGLLEADEAGFGRHPLPGEPTLRQVLDQIADRVGIGVAAQSSLWRDDLLPSLRRAGIAVVSLDDCDEGERADLNAAFHGSIFPVLTPLAVGPGRPFPYISSLSLSLGVLVRDPATGSRRFARVKVPEVLPRFRQIGHDTSRFLPIENLIAANLDSLFPGMVIEEHAAFRVTRDADFEIEEEADDLLTAVEAELRRRRFGEVVRLELEAQMSAEMRDQLVRYLRVDPRQVYAIDGLLDLADIGQLASLPISDLRYPEWNGVTQRALQPGARGDSTDIFAAMRAGDLIVHHPYDAFSTSVERFIEQAVDDPDVLAIKHTIYRTSGESPIVPGLIRAAEQGKQAVVLVELKARFDEEKNIGWARAMERAGVHVVYGFAELKTHAKCALVVRREGNGIRRYAHIGTGNYHPRTARLYTDLGLLTCRTDITADVADLFNYLTGFARPRRYRKLLVAPLDLRDRILDEVDRCVREHSEEQPSRIVMKMNALVDRPAIEALYAASQAGVRIELVVRGICCLVPGVKGLSESIRVVSVLGRFLEHERVYRFGSGGETRHYIGSADLMPRNLDHRVEVVAPVEDPVLRRRIDAILEAILSDNRGAWELTARGDWRRLRPSPGAPERSAQEELMQRALSSAGARPEDGPAELDQAERIVRRVTRRPGAAAE